MINYFIAIIVALFFWGNSTKDKEEKTKYASITKTLIFLVFSIAIGVFYYKTCQVATIYNAIEVKGVRVSKMSNDSVNHVSDTVSIIVVRNAFSSGGIYDREFSKYIDSKEKNAGGVFINVDMHNKSPYTICSEPSYNNVSNQIPFDSVGHVYMFSTYSTRIPSLIPLFITYEESDSIINDTYYSKALFYDVRRHPETFQFSLRNHLNYSDDILEVNNKELPNAYMWQGISASSKSFVDNSGEYSNFRHYFYSKYHNTMNFFTAADISQYVHIIQIKSSCPVSEFVMEYDVPIKTTALSTDMDLGTYGFSCKGKYLSEMVNSNTAPFHIVLPTLANLQLIRSLILTTLLTTLISLFLSNLYFLIRKWMVYFKNEKLGTINEDKFRILKNCLYFILFVFLGLISYMSYLVFYDAPIDIPSKSIMYILCGILLLIICFFVIVLLQFKKMYLPKKSKK